MAASGEFGFGRGGTMQMRRLAALLGLALPIFLAGCGAGESGSVDLAVACETDACTCTNGGPSAKPPAVLWKTDGTAYCPDGYSLYRIPPPSQRWTVGPGLQ
jgi:hypothetical protein